MIASLRERARRLKREIDALALACKDPRTPLIAKILAAAVVAYALSPIDLIPDFIPVLGYLDDLILVPLGIWLVIRMIPADVMSDARAEAARMEVSERPRSLAAAIVIIMIWLVLAIVALRLVIGLIPD
jgi:uncharacterized membrane protein YkvA (DUF1232 family)